MNSRHHAREVTLQILYLWEIGGTDPANAVSAFFAGHEPDAEEAVKAYAATIVPQVVEAVPRLDQLISQHAKNWRIERMSIIDRLILRLGTWELLHERDTPPAVILNEAIELARTFGTDDSVKFVNGVLDGIRKTTAASA